MNMLCSINSGSAYIFENLQKRRVGLLQRIVFKTRAIVYMAAICFLSLLYSLLEFKKKLTVLF